MPEKRILIIDSDLLARIDANRGESSQAEFINMLIESHLGGQGQAEASQQYVSREEFEEFSQGMKDLLRRFLDFFISYGMELGAEPKDHSFGELVTKLQSMSNMGVKAKAPK